VTQRPILRLKRDPAPPAAVAAPAPEPAPRWKCKPCGALIDLLADIPGDEAVRCAKCGARLGLARDFSAEGGGKVRARRA
jgi:DNA-directed RNA polymerase subunit RPC12/RpoP